ncbi:MAG: DHH family phosphoesterase [Patescibacteria group bacterium]
MQSNNQKYIIDLIKRSKNILVLPSSPPDGDSLGSAIALYIILKKLNKDVTVIASDPVPEVYDFLPSINIVGTKMISSNDFIITIDCKKIKVDKIKSAIEDNKVNIIISPKDGHFSESDISFNKGEVSFDLIITVDTAELSQLRVVYDNNIEMFQQIPVINIDHHISNTHFGKINHVDIMASSTTELLFPVIEQMAQEENINLIDEDVATLLLTGIITDTGSFQNANTTPRSFDVASQLIAYGARQQEIIQYIYKTKQLSQLKLWGRVLSKIQTDEENHIVWSVVSQQDFRDTGSNEDETGDIIDELMTNAPGAEVILLIKEKKNGVISGSIRTTTSAVDSSKIAEVFDGGGHTQAAGFRLENIDLREAEYKIINVVKEFQQNRRNAMAAPLTTPAEPLPTSTETPKPTKSPKPQQPQPEASFEIKPPILTAPIEKPEPKETEIHPGVTYKFED